MSVLDEHVVQFTRLIEEGWGREAVDYGVNRQDLHHLLSSRRLLR